MRGGHTKSCGCLRMSRGEELVASILLQHNIPFIREYSAFIYDTNRPAKFDFFVNESYLIEVDGETHFNANVHG